MWEKLRLCLWPRRSFARSMRYMGKRLLRIPASPHIVALGLAIGIFFAATPLYGLHIVFAIFFAWVFSANIAAAALGTILANPFTIPFIFSAAYETGRLILPPAQKGVPIPVLLARVRDCDFSGLAPALFQISAGSAILGLGLALLAYMLAFRMTKRFQEERKKRFQRRHGHSGACAGAPQLRTAFAALPAAGAKAAGKAASAEYQP